MGVPGEGGDLVLVTRHCAEFLGGLYIPEFDVTCADADAEEHSIVGKVKGGDVRGGGSVAEMGDGARVRAPDVDGSFEGNCDHVKGRPGEEVEVEVVDEVGCLEDAFWLGGDAAGF